MLRLAGQAPSLRLRLSSNVRPRSPRGIQHDLTSLCSCVRIHVAPSRWLHRYEDRSLNHRPARTSPAVGTCLCGDYAGRDPKALSSLIAEDAVFINGGQPLRGRAAIVQFWERFFTGPSAPFSWEPSIVEVASGGTRTRKGCDSGVWGKHPLTTTWQRQAHDGWLVIFDNGYRVCQ
ncbi:MAG: nuclear transport factor 2 family protein [Piscinibacter sp.]|nr:nuclear transport factor 2 family protein [Piscinibacter sp.]